MEQSTPTPDVAGQSVFLSIMSIFPIAGDADVLPMALNTGARCGKACLS